MHIPTIETVKKAAVGAVRDRNNLTFYDDTSATYKTKVCAICDRFILHGKECKITLEALQDKKVKELLSKKSLKWNSDVPSNVKLSLTKYYTCKAFDTGIGSTRWIREYVLSPRAFRAKAGKKDAPRAFRAKAGKKDAVGSCKLCAYEIKKARRGDTVAPSLPTHSIANGLMIGKAPLELTRLNDVEKALIARARIDKHIFSFEAGSHKSTKGWHTMFYNEVNAVLEACLTDGINFRITVMFKGEKGSETPPNFVLDEETLCVDGGSVMYCTCYVSKNTEKEDNKHFADAAKHMVKNMQQQMAEQKELLDLELEEEASSVGLKGMIGAALMATKVHKVAAPMASYLIRNGSRFHFSHNFSYVDIGSFFKAIQEDLNISADEDGSVF
ncbi:hypothetical protein IV203_036448 [Nitzschia inconspicua]|uniref:DUF6570 domain-containing protein n=1 Tax=Nitzschia inconspicua TaxID=303405 RepID=A0A9K3PVM8_9STRA|nr:hypothetical protein IV203_036448 [Nitzschia inconspicua]